MRRIIEWLERQALQPLDALLWFAVLGWASWLGGALYQHIVVAPLWQADMPTSLGLLFLFTDLRATSDTFFAGNALLLRLLPLVFALGVAWPRARLRWPVGAALAAAVAVQAIDGLYLAPVEDVLFAQAGAERGATALRALADDWLLGDGARIAAGALCLVALIHALAARAVERARAAASPAS